MPKDKSAGSTFEPEQALLFVVPILATLWLIKWLPLISLALLAAILFQPDCTRGKRNACRSLTANYTIAALTTFLLVGLPIDFPKAFPGLLGLLPPFSEFLLSAIQLWNKTVPNFLSWLRVRNYSLLDLAGLFWMAVGLSIPVAALFGWIKRKPPSPFAVPNKTQFGTASLAFLFTQMLFGRWFEIGREKHGKNVLWSLPTPCFWFAFLVTYALLEVFYFDLRILLLACSCLPMFGLLLGRWLPIKAALHSQKRSEDPGFCLGQLENGKSFTLSEANLGYHIEFVAPSGSGKTNLLQNLIANRIIQGHGVVFIDLKAELDLVNWTFEFAKNAGRAQDFRLISLADESLSVPYNPIKYGSASEIHSQIMNSLTWSEDFYRKVASMALQTVVAALCEYREKQKELFHLGHVLELLQSEAALEAFLSKLTEEKCATADAIETFAEQLSKSSERDKLMGLIAGLSTLIHSSAGKLLTCDVEKGSFDLNDAVDAGRITYFSINSLKLRESAAVFGKLVIQDLMRLVGERYSQTGASQQRPVTVIIDEFASFAIPEFISLMDRARGAGIGIVIAHQSRADLRSISPEFQERIEANANTTIVSGVKSSDDADYYSGIIGTNTVMKETIQKEYHFGFWPMETGMRSARDAEEYILHPNKVKELQQGEVLVITRTIGNRWARVQVPKALQLPVDREGARSAFQDVRQSYLSLNFEKYVNLKGTRPPIAESTPVGSASSSWLDIVGMSNNLVSVERLKE
jgi:type IV secretory pathway TraG/TraD family ATPase VirD4